METLHASLQEKRIFCLFVRLLKFIFRFFVRSSIFQSKYVVKKASANKSIMVKREEFRWWSIQDVEVHSFQTPSGKKWKIKHAKKWRGFPQEQMLKWFLWLFVSTCSFKIKSFLIENCRRKIIYYTRLVWFCSILTIVTYSNFAFQMKDELKLFSPDNLDLMQARELTMQFVQ